MYWLFLYFAIGLEVAATSFMKVSNGFKNMSASIFMVICYIVSLALLTFSLKKIEIGIAYAIWSGLGTVIISVIGILFFRESISLMKFMAIGLIVVGVILLNLNGSV